MDFESIAPGVLTESDYRNYDKGFSYPIPDDWFFPFESLSTVRVFDSEDKKFKPYRMRCSIKTMVLVGCEDNAGCTMYSQWVSPATLDISYEEIALEQAFVTVDGDKYLFSNEKDASRFYDLLETRNRLIDSFAKSGVEKCFELSDSLYDAGLSEAIGNFLDMLPSQMIEDFLVERAFFFYISRADLTSDAYYHFNDEQAGDCRALLLNGNNMEIFDSAKELFENLRTVIVDELDVDSSLSTLTTYLLIRRGAMDRMAPKWTADHDRASSSDDMEDFVEKAALGGEVMTSDLDSMATLTYYLMSKGRFGHDPFVLSFSSTYALVQAGEEKKKHNLFRNQLFRKDPEKNSAECVSIDDVDLMSGDEFEDCVCRLFKRMGYSARVTQHSGDQGVDVIAEKGTAKLAIQAKCYGSAVGNSAVQEAVAGMAYYGCNKAMVVSNSTFTKGASELARANGVVLWGRDVIKQKLLDYPVEK